MNNLKCLFIEDSQTDVEIIEWKLKRKSILLEYIIVETESELNLTLLDNDFDLIISDHNMPCLDSIIALEKCKLLAPKTPFIVFSIYIPEKVIYSLRCKGVHAIIKKYDVEILYQLIQQIIFK